MAVKGESSLARVEDHAPKRSLTRRTWLIYHPATPGLTAWPVGGRNSVDRGEKVAILAVVVNLLLFGLKYIFAELSGSIGLKAEAFDSLSDVVASATVFGGLKLAKRKTDLFPYGLYKMENLVAVLVAFAIFFAGYKIVVEATTERPASLQNVGWAVASVVCAIVIAYGFSRYEARVGREINSPALTADAAHISIDVFAHGVVLVGLLSSLAGINLDRIAAFVVVLLIFWAGGRIFLSGIRVLLDASLDYKTLRLAEELISREAEVIQIQDLVGRSSGRYTFIEANIVLKTRDLHEAHSAADRIEKSIKEEIANVDKVLIHYEPMEKENLVYAVALDDVDGQRLSDHFGDAPHFMLVTVRAKDKQVIDEQIVENPFVGVEKGKGILVAEFLERQAVDVFLAKQPFKSRGPAYVFSAAAIDIHQTDEETVEKALEGLGISVSSLDASHQGRSEDD